MKPYAIIFLSVVTLTGCATQGESGVVRIQRIIDQHQQEAHASLGLSYPANLNPASVEQGGADCIGAWPETENMHRVIQSRIRDDICNNQIPGGGSYPAAAAASRASRLYPITVRIAR
jgi:hypothetical protein